MLIETHRYAVVNDLVLKKISSSLSTTVCAYNFLLIDNIWDVKNSNSLIY